MKTMLEEHEHLTKAGFLKSRSAMTKPADSGRS